MSLLLRREPGRLRRRHRDQVWRHQHTLISTDQRDQHCFCRKTLTTHDERARSATGLRKLSETPSQTRDFAGRATSRARRVRHCETAIRNLEAGIDQDDIGHVTPAPTYHFLVDGSARAGVAPPALLISAPRIAAALSRPVPWPFVDTIVCGTSRPISETISGFSLMVLRSCWTRVMVSTRSCPSTSACARCPWAISSSSSFWPSPRSFAAFLFCSET